MRASPLREAVRTFCESLPAEKGYSIHTCRAYRRDLDEFVEFLETNLLGSAAVAESAQALDRRTRPA